MTPFAMSLLSPSPVHQAGYDFKVADTELDSARMVDFVPVRYDLALDVGNYCPMDQVKHGLMVLIVVQVDDPVADSVSSACPEVMVTRLVDLRPDPLG
jgi:hypothetical protein